MGLASKTVCRLRAVGQRLLASEQGSIYVMSAVALLVIIAAIGGGVEMARAYQVKNRLQNACDAAALAGRRAVDVNGYDTSAQAQADKFFGANFNATTEGVTASAFDSSSEDDGVTVTGNASATLPLVLMPIFGFETITVSADCSATEGIGNVDVTFVLDTTGSMTSNNVTGTNTTRLSALRTAMKDFYTVLDNAVTGSSARVRYAFVPYSTTVNVGHLLYNLDPDYLVDTWGIQSRVARFETTTTQTYSYTTSTKSSSNGWGGGGTSTSSGTAAMPITEEAYYSTPNGSATSYSGSYASLPACLTAMPDDTAWSNNGSTSSSSGTGTTGTYTRTSQPQIMTSYTCYRSGDVYYVYAYKSYRYYYTYAYATSSTVTSNNKTTTYTATPGTTTATTTSYDHFDYKVVKYDTSSFKAFNSVTTATGNSGAAVSTTWDGCIEERYTVSNADPEYSSSSDRITPTDALDLDIDSAPTSDGATKWAPLWDIGYYRSSSSSVVATSGSTTYYACPSAARALSEMTETAFDAYADGMTSGGNTYHDIGMLWGARLSTPDGIFSSVVNEAPSNGQSVSRHLIFMTDGEPQPLSTYHQAYGTEKNDKRVTSDGSDDKDYHQARFRALCDAVKAKGIRIWVIGFATDLTDDLTYCGSESSIYTANTVDELNTAFQTIAKQIGELRLSQ